ncbi:hypothetical protein ACFPM0_23835 [Pseudonocardia sulfidoxydans]
MLAYAGGWLRLMAAAVPTAGVVGYKQFHLADGNKVRYTVHLFDLATGSPIGIVDAALITTLRTAATAAFAARTFFGAGAGPLTLAVVGSGAEAEAGVLALGHLQELKSVRVFSRSVENRSRLAARLGHDGLEASAADSVHEALAGADLVYVATNSGGQVVLCHEDIAHLPFVASIGSTLPAQRELDSEVFLRAGRIVLDTFDALKESGDLIAARERGFRGDGVRLLGDMEPGAPDIAAPTVFKSIGSPEQDVLLAHAIIQRAAADGFGTRIAPLQSVKVNL